MRTPELKEKKALFYGRKIIENFGIDHSTSRMQSRRSTI